MKALKPFDIAFVGLSNGVHEYPFEIEDAFFACFEGSLIQKAHLQASLFLHKKSTMMDLQFVVKGKVELTCDRCMEVYWQQIEVDRMLYVKFGEAYEEQGDEILVIPHNESHVDVSQYFYEFIVLGLPIRHIHPGGENPTDRCNEETLKLLERYMTNEGHKPDAKGNNEDKPRDSRWDALKNIKFN